MTTNLNQNNDERIDLRGALRSLKNQGRFIFGFTSVVTLITIIYFLSLNSPSAKYDIKTYFVKPSTSSAIKLNQNYFLDETTSSMFYQFLNNVSSKSFQKKVFIEGDYLNKLNKEPEAIDDIEKFINLISVSDTSTSIKRTEDTFELPFVLSTQGLQPDILSELLDEIVDKANKKTIDDFFSIQQLNISNRLNEIAVERRLLLSKAEEDRLSQIERIKELDDQRLRVLNNQIDAVRLTTYQDRLSQIKRIKELDSQKLREIYQKIDLARSKAKAERLNQIVIFSSAADLAASLGFTNNNLTQVSEVSSNVNLNIEIKNNDQVPDWYLYGEKALIQMIKTLKNRTSDDPYIPELIALNTQIKEIKNNPILKTLEERLDDDPYIPELITLNNRIKEIKNNPILKTLAERLDDSPFIEVISELDIEKTKLESLTLNSTGVNAMQVYQSANSSLIAINNKNTLIMLLALIVSFMLSIFLSLIFSFFKEEDSKIGK
ncbi:hypothetical protein N9I58_03005 [Candidatus Thioglobus sp.]|nr:hypothetical protein [Candidatus Thioglobus sp.]